MVELQFEWDDRKEKANIKKHGVSFEEARTVFYDENGIQFFDPDHSGHEDRFVLLGLCFKPRILVVTVSERVRQSYGSFRLERLIKMKNVSIGGEENERPLRFFQDERA